MKSYQYPAAVRDHSKTKGSVQHVLLILATFANDNGECFPSYTTLVKATGLSLKTIRRAISAIPTDELQIIEKGKAAGRPSKYRIIINEKSPDNCGHGDHSQNGNRGHGDHRTMVKNDPNYGHGDPLTTQELPIELPRAHKRAPDSSSAVASSKNGTTDPPIPEILQTPEFLEAWKDYDEHRHKIEPKKWTPLAKKKALNKLAKWGPAKAIEALNDAVINGWQGFYEPKEIAHQKPKRSVDEFPNL
jgi:hypothetical protein